MICGKNACVLAFKSMFVGKKYPFLNIGGCKTGWYFKFKFS